MNFLSINKHDDFGHSYLFDLKTKEGLNLYFACKDKYDFSLTHKEKLIQLIADTIKTFIEKYDWIAVPESSHDFTLNVLKQLNTHIPIYIIRKTSIDNMIVYVDTLNLQRKEKLSHLERIYLMGNSFKIHMLKANQRRKYEEVVFQKQPYYQGNGVVVDDSFFSGTTVNALKHVLPHFDYLSIFSK